MRDKEPITIVFPLKERIKQIMCLLFFGEVRLWIKKAKYLKLIDFSKSLINKVHKIGKHGAVGWVTQKGRICAECGKPIKEKC